MREAWRREPGFAVLLMLCVALAVVVSIRAERAHDGAAVTVAEFKPPVSALIDINSADATLLMTLPGVGEKTAQRIIDGRPYSEIDDLLDVYGIGEKTLDGLRDRVCVGAPDGDVDNDSNDKSLAE